MKCSKAHELIGELLEGTIRGEDRRELEKHLESCDDCRELLADFQKIQNEAAALPKLEPSADVWPNILDGVRRARETESARPAAAAGRRERLFVPGRPRYALAAALSLGLIVGGAFLIRGPGEKTVPAAGVKAHAFTMAKLEEAETHYRLAIQALQEAAAAQKTGLAPETMAALKADLRKIDEVIAACRETVQGHPQSIEARVYLLGAYKGKLEFLDKILAAGRKSTAPSTTDIVL